MVRLARYIIGVQCKLRDKVVLSIIGDSGVYSLTILITVTIGLIYKYLTLSWNVDLFICILCLIMIFPTGASFELYLYITSATTSLGRILWFGFWSLRMLLENPWFPFNRFESLFPVQQYRLESLFNFSMVATIFRRFCFVNTALVS